MLNFRETAVAGAMLLVAALLVSGCDQNRVRAVEPLPEVVVRVNDAFLTDLDLEDELNKIIPASSFHGTISEEKKNRYRPEALENLIENELLYQEAKRMKLPVDKQLVEQVRESAIRRVGGTRAFKIALQQRRITDKEFRRMVERDYLIGQMIAREIEEKSKVADDEVAQYYTKNESKYAKPEARRLWHVLIKLPLDADEDVRREKRDKAQGILEKARSGGDLYKIAWDESEDAYKVKGGDLGYVHKGSLASPLEEVAFSLPKGGFSNVVESDHGYHVMGVMDIQEPRQLTLDDVSAKLKKEMQERRRKERREELISTLKANAVIEVFK